MEIDSPPGRDRRAAPAVDRLKMEEIALEQETDAASADRLARLRAELADRSEQLARSRARWESEKSGLNRVGELKEQIDDLRTEADELQREGGEESFRRAGEIEYGEIPRLEKELEQAAGGRADRA